MDPIAGESERREQGAVTPGQRVSAERSHHVEQFSGGRACQPGLSQFGQRFGQPPRAHGGIVTVPQQHVGTSLQPGKALEQVRRATVVDAAGQRSIDAQRDEIPEVCVGAGADDGWQPSHVSLPARTC